MMRENVHAPLTALRVADFDPAALDLGGLLDAIRAGTCVAFVGAGFSAAADIPDWPELLRRVASHPDLDPNLRAHVENCLSENRADSFEEAAQLLREELKDEFIQQLRRQMEPKLTDQMRRRLEYLRGIPFRAVLTTNFDATLEGQVASPKSFRAVLKARGGAWDVQPKAAHWARLWGHETPVVKLHGDLETTDQVILSRADYRRHLYGQPHYLGMLRSILLHNTVLFIGFSFSDNYLNELRSETLAMLGYTPEHSPIAYAIMNDVSDYRRRHFRSTEGIEVISYPTLARGGARDYTHFDRILERIYRETNPAVRLGDLLDGKRILWVDHEPDSVAGEKYILDEAVRAADADPHTITHVDYADAALRVLDERPFDLVISRYGEGQDTAKRLLKGIRKCDFEVPCIIFGVEKDLAQRKPDVMRWGAAAYTYTTEGLIRAIEDVLGLEEG